MFSRTHLPRATGDVLVATDVTSRILPWPSNPRRESSGSCHPAKAAAIDVRDAVVLCQPFVDKGVVGIQQIDHAAVFADDAVEEHFRFPPEGLPKIVVEVARFRPGALQFAKVKPLAGEVRGQRGGFRIGQHTARLLRQNLRIMQLVLLRQPQQFFVGNAAPQEEGKPGSQLDIADRVDAARRRARRLLLESGR